MKLTAQEEYGLRCLLHVARSGDGQSLTIPEISRAEGLSVPNVAKLMRLLRMGGLVTSVRGQAGGYALARPADQIKVIDVLELLGGQLFSSRFCQRHAGRNESCTHQVDCSVRVLWSSLQSAVESVLGNTTLKHLLCSEQEMTSLMNGKYRPAQSPASGLQISH